MASTFSSRPAAYHVPIASNNAPPGTFIPGTKVQVGNHRVVIEKYLSEGGFAHVYVVRIPRSGDKYETAVLKRVAVPDKDALANMRTEVETMKKLKGHKHIVTYMDSHASQLQGGGYEVFLLMEYCQGGGLIDFMNTRLQHRLTEPEILKIFSDVSEGVASMHYLKPPLLHRDLKVENVLISTSGSSRLYKVADFGSTAPPRPAATTAQEGRLIEEDIQRHTTLQYRSPEMIDVYRKQPIDEKSDIWALGVLLYKLCYYTTPFEDQGQMAILNASFKYPQYPSFSDRIKRLIGSMLKESPKARPNIYQVVAEICSMRNTSIPIKDIYAQRTQPEGQRYQELPSPEIVSSPPVIGIQKAAPVQEKQAIPDVVPMRRGRPTGPNQNLSAAKPSAPNRVAGDPFAALDSTSVSERSAAADELAAKFPSLDEFSILHDKGTKFQFSGASSPKEAPPESLNRRVTAALADEVFAKPTPPPKEKLPPLKPQPSSVAAPATKKPVPAERPEFRPPLISRQTSPQRARMVSTGTGASPPASPKVRPARLPEINARPIWRVPTDVHGRNASQPRPEEVSGRTAPTLHPEHALPPRPSMTDAQRSKSQMGSTLQIPKSPASSRPSLESSRPSALDINDPVARSKSTAGIRQRPTSLHFESSIDYLRVRENRPTDSSRGPVTPDADAEPEDKNIRSSVDYLRAIEDKDPSKRSKRSSFGHSKRASMTSLSLSNTKSMLAGKFGDAFRRFEAPSSHDQPLRTPSPSFDTDRMDRLDDPHSVPTRTGSLYPIAGSVATDDTASDLLDETQELSPDVKRELERRALDAEEKRVEEAARAYQARVAKGEVTQGLARASTIQSRVRTLLDESRKEEPVKRTAEGYGKYTRESETGKDGERPTVPGKKSNMVSNMAAPAPPSSAPPIISTSSSTSGPATQRTGPTAPPKPKKLQTGGTNTTTTTTGGPSSFPSPVKPSSSSLANKRAVAPQHGLGIQDPVTSNNPTENMSAADAEAWEENFTRRYPSLSGFELVEAEIPVRTTSTSTAAAPATSTAAGRVRDV
ncbi:hypothetical protein EJ05DRAFT_528388 [Pseudovirgaria hyperparasitica]|uniref:non-specific serine/threonine protein kinase n=1 Tax=Pseudovirgaria hyperparasitica TaxID=470096 RepID=A0A6A6W6Z1_9PEZI|nr:uncharacterized protein EJ05DRAFT_528388 [Pseudovirgaria hyperparasitica]KAF2757969.1 hypothetical protein EJ05DRAFT_528388 [Pseudovirgaria hyperparasitica]